MRKRFFITMASMLALTIGMGVGASIEAKANDQQNALESISVTMEAGAGIRNVDGVDFTQNGIRYVAYVSEENYDMLMDLNDSEESAKVEFGMIIARGSDIKENPLNEATVFGKGGDKKYNWAEYNQETGAFEEYVAVQGLQRITNIIYEELPKAEDISAQYEGQDIRLIMGSMIDINESALTVERAGLAYIKYFDGENTYYKFAENNNNVLSMTYVAQKAIEKGGLSDSIVQALKSEYVDKVNDKSTTISVHNYFENENGEYVYDSASDYVLENQVINEKVSVSDLSFNATLAEKPGFIINRDKTNEASDFIVMANGHSNVNVYYKKAQTTSIDAVYTQGNNLYYCGDNVNDVKHSLVVTATFEGGTQRVLSRNEYTISGTFEEGATTLEVSAYDLTDTFEVEVIADYRTMIENFDNVETAQSIHHTWGGNCWVGVTGQTLYLPSGNLKLDKKHGTEGKAYGFAAGNNTNAFEVFDLNVGNAQVMYFYVYFDSSTVVQGDKIVGLPTISDRRIATLLAENEWTVTAETEKAWDAWILVKAVRVAGNNASDCLGVNPLNTYEEWGIAGGTGKTGFSCVVYFDDFYIAGIKSISQNFKQGAEYIYNDDSDEAILSKLVGNATITYSDGSSEQLAAADFVVDRSTLASEGKIGLSYKDVDAGTVSIDIFNRTMIENFDNVETAKSIHYNWGTGCWMGVTGETLYLPSGNLKLDKKHGTEGKAYGITAGNNINGFEVFKLNVGKTAKAMYFYVYFDSSTVIQGNKIVGLPEITDTRIATLVDTSEWTLTAVTEKAWDTWILIKADRLSKASDVCLGVSPNNTYEEWGIAGGTGKTGFSCVVYFDDFFIPEEVVEVDNRTMIENFDNVETAQSIHHTWGGNCWVGVTGQTLYLPSGNLKLDKKHGTEGKAYGFVAANEQAFEVFDFNIGNAQVMYFYVYFDSSTVVQGDNIEGLPTISDRRIATLLAENEWTVTAETEKAWDTWILVKAVRVAGNNASDCLGVNPLNTYEEWGIEGGTGSTGFSCVVYFDDFYILKEE